MSGIRYGDGATNRDIKKIYYQDGSTKRTIKKIWYGDNGTNRLVFNSMTLFVVPVSLSQTSGHGNYVGTATAVPSDGGSYTYTWTYVSGSTSIQKGVSSGNTCDFQSTVENVSATWKCTASNGESTTFSINAL